MTEDKPIAKPIIDDATREKNGAYVLWRGLPAG